MEEPIILCDNLVKIYKIAGLEVVALQGLELAVAKGELIGIVGASGSGKSTLLNILGGLDRPSAGRVWVNGKSLLEMSDAALTEYRRTQVGFVWQQGARNLIPFLTALENIELPMTLAGQPARQTRRRAEELLEAVDLTDRRNHRLPQLSGGEQQRVAIAVALANQPAILLADEPTGELDTANAHTIYKAFQDLNRLYQVTTLIVSHDLGIAHQVHRVVAIRDGKTSSETVRVNGSQGEATAVGGPQVGIHPVDQQFEELVVLDSAGRLQVPKEYLEKLAIKGRARLEMTEDGILIRPAPTSALDQAAQAIAAERVAEHATGSRPRGLRAWLKRMRAGQ